MMTTSRRREVLPAPSPFDQVLARVAVAALVMLAVNAAGFRSSAVSAQTSGAQRIVSLVPAVTEMLFAIGAGDQVVGVSSYDRFPPEVTSRPKVGALVDPDVERILSLRPDLVVVYGTQAELIARLDRARVPMFPYKHATLADVTQTIRGIGARVGRAERAGVVADTIERDLKMLRARGISGPRPTTALVFEREPGSVRGLFASGGRGFLNDLLEIAGAANVFGDVQRESLQVSVETLLARRPEVIIEIRPSEGWTPALAARERAVWQTLSSIPAVRNGRVHILADDKIAVPGPRVADSARVLAEAISRSARAAGLSAFAERDFVARAR